MRVLHLANAFPTTTTPEYGVFVQRQVVSLERLGVHCDVYHINARDAGKGAYLRAIRELPNLIDGCDLVHCHHILSAAALRLSGARKPHIVSLQNEIDHELEIIRWKQLRRWTSNQILSKANVVISKSPSTNGLRAKSVAYVPNGVDLDDFSLLSRGASRRILGLDPERIYLLFVSSKSLDRKQKRVDRFDALVKMLQARNPRFQPIYLTNTPQEKAKLFYSAADVHVLTSDFEGSPNSVKEAIALGTPVVTTPVGDTAQILKDVPGCFQSDSFDVAKLASLVEKSVETNHTAEVMRKKLCENGYEAMAIAQRVLDCYGLALSGNAAGA